MTTRRGFLQKLLAGAATLAVAPEILAEVKPNFTDIGFNPITTGNAASFYNAMQTTRHSFQMTGEVCKQVMTFQIDPTVRIARWPDLEELSVESRLEIYGNENGLW